MAKTKLTKSINDRPIIMVSVSTQNWKIRFDPKKNEYHFKNHGNGADVHPKAETLKTGEYTVCLAANYSRNLLLPNGTQRSIYDCKRKNLQYRFPSFEAAMKLAKKDYKDLSHIAYITREARSYYDLRTGATTTNKAEALKWYEGQDPIFVGTSQYQRLGAWIEPGKDYVDVKLYYLEKAQRSLCQGWKEGTMIISRQDSDNPKKVPVSLRIYNDGTVANFYKGKVNDPERVFCADRVKYHSLDVRFYQQWRGITMLADLRAEEIVGPDGSTTGLCETTRKILKKCGFPTEFWVWDNYKKEFDDVYDLILYAQRRQKEKMSKKAVPMSEFLADKPFNVKGNQILDFDSGVIVRIPGYIEEWEDVDGTTQSYVPYNYAYGVAGLLRSAKVYEEYRLYISYDGKKRICQENVHNGSEWKNTRWDNIHFVSAKDIKDRIDRTEKGIPEQAKEVRRQVWEDFKTYWADNYDKLFKKLTCLKRIQDWIEANPIVKKPDNVLHLLRAFYQAPKLTETLIKTGRGNLFFFSRNRYYGAEDDRKTFYLENVLELFNVGTYSFKEKASNTIYQTLGLTKAQYNWLISLSADECHSFLTQFKNQGWGPIIPGSCPKRNYSCFAEIPLDQVQFLFNVVNQLHRQQGGEYWSAAHSIRRLLDYGVTVADLQKIASKDISLTLYVDYLRMRSECVGNEVFHDRDWPLIPQDARDLNYMHNRIFELRNLINAERNRYYRESEEERLKVLQEKYNLRYKKLKSLEYSEEDDSLCIVVPQKLVELTLEGQVLHHCVGSFATSVGLGTDTIVFLRRKDAPTVPYATISLLRNDDQWYIDQAHTAHNGAISEEDVEFLKRWGKKNDVIESSIKINYGLHCHH